MVPTLTQHEVSSDGRTCVLPRKVTRSLAAGAPMKTQAGAVASQVIHLELHAIDVVLHVDAVLLELKRLSACFLLHHGHVLRVILQLLSNPEFSSLAVWR